MALKMLERGLAVSTTLIESEEGKKYQSCWKAHGDLCTQHFSTRKLQNLDNDALDSLLSEGTKAYLRAIQMNPEEASLHYDLALNFYYKSQVLDAEEKEEAMESAMEQMKIAIRLKPKNPEYWNGFGILMKDIDPNFAQHAFIRGIMLGDLVTSFFLYPNSFFSTAL